ncbi:MAG: hypothetical protein K1Y02_24530, partial [Candidatus Hydrogenedentes bacterium]|nr:hypothetical protein [Candidatus Hydrogenedentota bacterium]
MLSRAEARRRRESGDIRTCQQNGECALCLPGKKHGKNAVVFLGSGICLSGRLRYRASHPGDAIEANAGGHGSAFRVLSLMYMGEFVALEEAVRRGAA